MGEMPVEDQFRDGEVPPRLPIIIYIVYRLSFIEQIVMASSLRLSHAAHRANMHNYKTMYIGCVHRNLLWWHHIIYMHNT